MRETGNNQSIEAVVSSPNLIAQSAVPVSHGKCRTLASKPRKFGTLHLSQNQPLNSNSRSLLVWLDTARTTIVRIFRNRPWRGRVFGLSLRFVFNRHRSGFYFRFHVGLGVAAAHRLRIGADKPGLGRVGCIVTILFRFSGGLGLLGLLIQSSSLPVLAGIGCFIIRTFSNLEIDLRAETRT